MCLSEGENSEAGMCFHSDTRYTLKKQTGRIQLLNVHELT